MNKITRLTAEERENLPAYLDGELDEAATQAIEQKLARSEVARREVEMLSRTWDLLNLLPQSRVSETFTEKTITTIRVSEKPLVTGQEAWVQTTRRVVILSAWAIVLGLAFGVGFQLASRLIPDSSRQLVEELPIIQNLDLYQEIESAEFLEELNRHRVFEGGRNEPQR